MIVHIIFNWAIFLNQNPPKNDYTDLLSNREYWYSSPEIRLLYNIYFSFFKKRREFKYWSKRPNFFWNL